MTKYRNYYKLFEQELNNLSKREKILVHVCCGPCSMYPLELLDKYFDITIYYENSNIYPKKEYDLRLNELERYLETANKKYKLIIPKYEHNKHLSKIIKYKDALEGGIRCLKCYGLRMDKCAKYAKENNFNYFTTIMSISPHKNSYYINELGNLLAEKYKINFIHSDFKKHDGALKNIELNKKYDLYRQEYCGCIYSLKDQIED